MTLLEKAGSGSVEDHDFNAVVDRVQSGTLPPGGSTGEVLTKASNADGDADWEAGGGSQPVLLTDPIAIDTAHLLSGADIEVLPAPDTGKAYMLLYGLIFYTFGMTPFTLVGNGPGGVSEPEVNPAAGVKAGVYGQVDGFLESSDQVIQMVPNAVSASCAPGQAVVYQSVELADGDGSAKLIVAYTLVDFS